MYCCDYCYLLYFLEGQVITGTELLFDLLVKLKKEAGVLYTRDRGVKAVVELKYTKKMLRGLTSNIQDIPQPF